MDPIFEHPVFDSARERIKRVKLKKHKKHLKIRCIHVLSVEVSMYFSVAKQVRFADEGSSVFNKCRDSHNKWRDG